MNILEHKLVVDKNHKANRYTRENRILHTILFSRGKVILNFEKTIKPYTDKLICLI